MKKFAPILIAATALALCGCSTDTPLFANDATKAKAADTNRDQNQEAARDMTNQQNGGTSMGSNYGKAGMGAAPSTYNPYH